ncbi:putative transcriptional coactivator [Clavispora lusitaniae]|uniref:Transcriptional coactivator n=1 Tax=Clavispora lusitaniae TaxID=36911 RepID=A0AA91Q4M3_CLALS|nr:putative transcriptional coactivator [Clavispora lusitaniae]
MVSSSSTGGVQPIKVNKRVQLESLISEFQQKLGNNWDKYHESLTSFLTGKLSRPELVNIISPLLKNGLVKYHNKLLLLNFANSLQDSPMEFSSELASFWSKKNAKSKNVRSTQYEKLKQNILGLPLKERRRIRSITRESGKRNKLSASITLTRQSLLPKIPMIQDKEQQQLQVNNLVQWQQDVVNGINTPLSTTSYELPDMDNLTRRVLMTMREHGLTGGVSSQVLEVISLGLEAHLKNIIESAMDVVRYRESKYASSMFLPSELNGDGSGYKSNGKASGDFSNCMFGGSNSRKRKHNDVDNIQKRNVVLNAEDMFNTLELFPYLVEPGGPRLRLANVMLENDDMASEKNLGYTLPPKPASLQYDQLVNGSMSERINDGTKNREALESKLDNGSVDTKEHEKKRDTQNSQSEQKQNDTSHIGTTDELKWMLHDLISSM